MSKFDISRSAAGTALALLAGTVGLAPLFPVTPAGAQRLPAPRDYPVLVGQGTVAAGTRIPVSLEEAGKILVAREETMPLTLKVAANIRDGSGNLLIPAGSEIVGQIEPAGRGSRFVARELIVNSERHYPLDASSPIVTRTETVREGASTEDILKGTLAGAGAATLISGLTGDRRIDALEVLAGAAIGTLAGWGLPEAGILGGGSQALVAIDPRRDLTLTVRSRLAVDLDRPANTRPAVYYY